MVVRKGDILEVHGRMRRAYGVQDWWPADSVFEVMVGAVLTQAASWQNVEKAIGNLKQADSLTPQSIRSIPETELEQIIYPVGYYRSKTRKLKAMANYIGDRFNDDFEAMEQSDADSLRNELLGVYGVGAETADSILLYALHAPKFVIDAYTLRIFHRVGVLPEAVSYSECQQIFEGVLKRDSSLFSEYHALIVHHGKEVCRKKPECEDCCLIDMCDTGQRLHQIQ